MIAELLCLWTTCVSMKGKILECKNYGKGTPYEMSVAATEHTSGAHLLFTTECIKPGEHPVVDWPQNLVDSIEARP